MHDSFDPSTIATAILKPFFQSNVRDAHYFKSVIYKFRKFWIL